MAIALLVYLIARNVTEFKRQFEVFMDIDIIQFKDNLYKTLSTQEFAVTMLVFLSVLKV